MNGEDFFHTLLDDYPSDSAARLLLAEWLTELGDERADTWRWLAQQSKHPYHAHNTWDWWNADSHNPEGIRLPNPIWERLPVEPTVGFPRCKEWPNRREAEEAIGVALADVHREED